MSAFLAATVLPGSSEALLAGLLLAGREDPALLVAVATVGTNLPGDFKIKKSKIRGVPSFGMICSVRELDLGEEHDGIWVLPEDATTGAPVGTFDGSGSSATSRPKVWITAMCTRRLPVLVSDHAPGSG